MNEGVSEWVSMIYLPKAGETCRVYRTKSRRRPLLRMLCLNNAHCAISEQQRSRTTRQLFSASPDKPNRFSRTKGLNLLSRVVMIALVIYPKADR